MVPGGAGSAGATAFRGVARGGAAAPKGAVKATLFYLAALWIWSHSPIKFTTLVFHGLGFGLFELRCGLSRMNTRCRGRRFIDARPGPNCVRRRFPRGVALHAGGSEEPAAGAGAARRAGHPERARGCEEGQGEEGNSHLLHLLTRPQSLLALPPSLRLDLLDRPRLLQISPEMLLQGSKETQEYHWLGAVHIKDVANAQVLLFESPSASGRYLCTNGIYQFRDFAEMVSKIYSNFPIHRFSKETQPGLTGCKDAAKRLIDLGLVFTPVEDAIRDAVESLKVKGFLEGQKSLP
ncbi:hypothetical protein NE237_028835 [Protea cynaroides]|uniref:Cinnamoyl CoA reductase n=1 Tax=Protea cynaroides TaxID=273540 RepID=A0A9Q0GQQ0_9MAGN|nr:hypothetical protein NE237_028835 [Protea cynaroides]